MAQPTWLPPLNSHENYSLCAVASQQDNPWKDISLIVPEFKISVNVTAMFCSEKSSNQRVFEGLSTNQVWRLPCFSITTPELCVGAITNLLLDMCIPFQFHRYIWRHKHLDDGGVYSDDDVQGTTSLIEKICNFLYDLTGKIHNQGHNVLPLNLAFSKRITIPDSELKAWCSWYDDKAEADPNFEYDYMRAISRPRTDSELYYESTMKFNAAAESSIEALEQVKIDDCSPTKSCTICCEEMEIESNATNLPCSHVFHGECIVKWLKECNMCPLCRFKLPTA